MTGKKLRAECVCGWSLERDERASNLPAENNERIVEQVASVHENGPRFGDRAEETHKVTTDFGGNTDP